MMRCRRRVLPSQAARRSKFSITTEGHRMMTLTGLTGTPTQEEVSPQCAWARALTRGLGPSEDWAPALVGTPPPPSLPKGLM